jgi:predicted acetyltransferase
VSFEVRPCADLDEFSQALLAIGQYFNLEATSDRIQRFSSNLPVERMHAAHEDGRIVGGAGAFEFEVTVPGAMVPCAGVTVVGTYPTHRRRGVLKAMMRAQLDDVHERGEPVAMLWASDEQIYGRFGYGLASWVGEASVPREAQFTVPVETRRRLRFVEKDEAMELFPKVWEQLRPEIPGMLGRKSTWWDFRILFDSPDNRDGGGPKRLVVLELDGEPEGYAVYRHRPKWEQGIPAGEVEVLEAMALEGPATAELWRFLLDIDWQERIESWLLPPDHPLFLLLANPRRARYRMGDSLWVRLVDVGAALSGRSYAVDGSIAFEVHDAVCPWNEGRWKLEGGTASRTDEPAELALDVDALGSAYLGAVSFAQLHSALRVEELVDGAIARADAVFGWRPLPWCPEIF